MVGTEPVFIASMSSSETDRKLNTLYLESYGVRVRIESNNKRLFNDARRQTEHALVGNFRIIDPVETPHVFRLEREEGGYSQVKNGEKSGVNKSRKVLLRYFDSMLRITIAEYAVGHVFLHAGVVGWKGKAIIMPARSFKGKSALTAELVRLGARYYSDEYAVLDEKGRVHPFPKDLSLRGIKNEHEQVDHEVEALGGKTGKRAIPVGLVVVTEYEERAKWNPKVLKAGRGMMTLIDNTVSIRRDPKFALPILSNVASNALIVKSKRGEARDTARAILQLLGSG